MDTSLSHHMINAAEIIGSQMQELGALLVQNAELLAALREYTERDDREQRNDRGPSGSLYHRARAAIARAEGVQS
jgi:hypothetical protein